MKHIPYVNSLGEEHVILELGLQKLHWRSGKSQKQYFMYMISLTNSELRILALLQLLSISDKSGLQSQCTTSGEEKTQACWRNAAESTDLVSLEERESGE